MKSIMNVRLRLLLILFLSTISLASFSFEKENRGRYYSGQRSSGDSVVYILAIGNSFSADALESYLYPLAEAADHQIVIGNLYIAGASLSKHWQVAQANKAVYSYRKIDLSGNKATTPHVSIEQALKDEKWDYISFQQSSSYSGQYKTFEESLPPLFNYVKERMGNQPVQYILHQTWAYAQNSTHKGFANYDQSQAKMYAALVDAIGRAKKLVPINLLVPAGTAIQNGRTSSIGDHFCRDGYHLDLNIGRYTAACAWFESIFKESVIGNPFKPEALTDREATIAQHAAHAAVLKPNAVTEMRDFQTETVGQ